MSGQKFINCLILGFGLLFHTEAEAVSFDCKGASNWFERNVCKDPELGHLDDELSKTYKFALQTSKNPENLRMKQRRWLKDTVSSKHNRENCDTACTDSLIRKRIGQLRIEFFPKNEGSCIDLKIEDKHGRLKTSYDDTAILEFGYDFRVYVNQASKIEKTFPADRKYSKYDRKAFSDEYLDAVGNYAMTSPGFEVGDRVKVCLLKLPKNCPRGDARGKKYSITSYKDSTSSIEGVDSWHGCGGV